MAGNGFSIAAVSTEQMNENCCEYDNEAIISLQGEWSSRRNFPNNGEDLFSPSPFEDERIEDLSRGLIIPVVIPFDYKELALQIALGTAAVDTVSLGVFTAGLAIYRSFYYCPETQTEFHDQWFCMDCAEYNYVTEDLKTCMADTCLID